MALRWDNDTRGHGVADASRLLAGARELLAALDAGGWVAEEPDAHLLPHIRTWCAGDTRLELINARTDLGGAYVLELAWKGRRGDLRGVRAAVFSLIGAVAENATYVRQQRAGMASDEGLGGATKLSFEVATGSLAGDSAFAAHGHVLILQVANAR